MEQVVNFTEARHNVLAGNIANLDTPGYQVRDLSVEDFQKRLGAAIRECKEPAPDRSPGEIQSPGEIVADRPDRSLAKVSKDSKTILRHDKGNVGIEYQVSEMVKNQMQHNLALSIMNSQFRLLHAAISGQA